MSPFKRSKPQIKIRVEALGKVEDLQTDLTNHLYRMYYALQPRIRQMASWVMNGEWWNECRKLKGYDNGLLVGPRGIDGNGPDHLMGRPVEIRDDGGTPHLEVTV